MTLNKTVNPYNLRAEFVKAVIKRLDKDAEAKRVGYRRGRI